MRPTADLPHDPRLPGLMAIRDRGLARAIPALGLEQGGVGAELVLCGYHPGARATLDARVGQRRFAVKTFADDPAPEAALYQALGAAGLAGDYGARVPPLLAWDHDLRVLVIGWLEGPTTHELVKQGQGRASRGGGGGGRRRPGGEGRGGGPGGGGGHAGGGGGGGRAGGRGAAGGARGGGRAGGGGGGRGGARVSTGKAGRPTATRRV